MAEAGKIASGSGCPDCGAKKAAISRRIPSDFWLERAKLKNLKWIEMPENNSIKKKIECLACGYGWKVIPENISRGTGCPQCSGTIVSHKTWNERAAAVGIKWLTIPTDARIPSPAKCLTCGFEWKPNPGGVTTGSGCPDCAETGFKAGQPGLLYFIERTNSKGRPARKIGISNTSSSEVRLALWRRQGFVLKHTITHPTGQVIYDLEQAVLKWLRHELGLPQYLDKEEMPFGGATETFQPDLPSNGVVVQKLEQEFTRLKKMSELT
jgi:predicted Zn-ribbon and HTH transcriptional regulator